MKITAVVVTYNRLELLKQCIESIRNQTQKLDEIIVVNNDSIDGTFEWLNSQEDITHINQKNLGGAGGFYTGIKTAYNNGFDWIWCMDDDGLPEIKALENLLGSHHIAQVKGPIVVDKLNHQSLAFRIPIGINPNTKEQMFTWSLKEVVENFKDGVIYNWISIFNGVLMSKKVIEMIGFPRKEMWIYGDEFEYLRRIKNCNLEYITIVGAIHYHPRFKLDTNIGFFNKEIITNYIPDKKIYFLFRNLGYLSIEDYRFFNIKFIIAQFFSQLTLHNFSPKNALFFLKAYIDGIFNRVSKSYTNY